MPASEGPFARDFQPLEGGCCCGAIRYKVTAPPMIVHACHCRDCQRLSGTAFAVNLWIERKFVAAIGPAPKTFRLVGGSGKDNVVSFCGACGTTLWSRYHVVRGDCLFVRAGTLDRPDAVAPDVHIQTRTKQPWITLPEGARSYPTMYKLEDVWTQESRDRLRANAAAAG